MPTPTANISGDINAAIGEVSTIRATVVYSDPVWADETNNAVIVGGGVIPVSPTGGIDVDLPQTTDTVRVAINLEYVDNATRQRKSATSGWQELTADVDLAEFMSMTPTSVPASTAEALAARIDGYTDHGDVSGTLAVDPATGTHVLNATGALLVTLAEEPNGTIVTLYVIGGAENVTVDGISDLELTDGAFASFVRIRGAWVLASAGASSEPATPDTTPPSAVTTLAASGGEGQISLTWSAATDAENPVSYRYRAWLTSAGANGDWTTTADTTATITGLASGAYTAEVYAYSAGGASATDTATATVDAPAGWSVVATDDFTAADGTALAGRTTTTGGLLWNSGGQTSPTINGNKLAPTESVTRGMLTLPGDSPGVRVSFDYALANQADSTPPALQVSIETEANSPIMDLRPGDGGMVAKIIGYDSADTYRVLGGPAPTGLLSGRATLSRVGNVFTMDIEGIGSCTYEAERVSYLGTAFGEFTFQLVGFNASSIDNLVVEVYS